MSARNLELAHEFADLVGAPDLLTYLGVDQTSSPEESRKLLKEKRRYMQGMQSNPKYKRQALFLIKHFSALDSVLELPLEYLDDVRRRKESEHLPVLEMTIKGVLKGGQLNQEQVAYLQHQANELGVSEQTFQERLATLCDDAGVDAPLPRISESEREADYYAILGLTQAASRDEVYDAYRNLYREAKAKPEAVDSRRKMELADQAWRVLGDPRTREAYDLALEQTAPPGVMRTPSGSPVMDNDGALTAPPVRRESAPNATTPLQIFGDPVRSYSVTTRDLTDTIRLKTTIPTGGFITSTAPEWLKVSPVHLKATDEVQEIAVTITPDFDGLDATGAIHIVTEHGDRAQVVVEAYRPRVSPLTAFLAVAAVLAVGLAVFVGSLSSPGMEGAPGLTIKVDPRADDVTLNGTSVGNGSVIYVANPPGGEATLRITQRNFKTLERKISVPEGEAYELAVQLDLSEPMTFQLPAGGKPADLDLTMARAAAGPRKAAMEECIRERLEPGKTASGKVFIYVGESGRAKGFLVEGLAGDDPATVECIKRQAAAVYVHPLGPGEFSSLAVRYDVKGK
jgi:DnaJ-domain-containing protein 1